MLKKIKRNCILVCVVSIAVTFAHPVFISDALALSCSKDIKKSYNTSDAIIIGEVLWYREITPEKKPIYKGAEATVKIIESIKGKLKEGDEIKIDLIGILAYGYPKLKLEHNYVLFLKAQPYNSSYQLQTCSIHYEYTENIKQHSDLLKLNTIGAK